MIIPQKEDLSHDYSHVCLIDTAQPGTQVFFFITLRPRVERYTKSVSLEYEPASERQMKCQLLTLRSVGGLPTHDSRLFQVGTRIYAVTPLSLIRALSRSRALSLSCSRALSLARSLSISLYMYLSLSVPTPSRPAPKPQPPTPERETFDRCRATGGTATLSASSPPWR